jgi:hypothetical protein
MVERNPAAIERLSERERTLILAILATRPRPSRLTLNSNEALDSGEQQSKSQVHSLRGHD